jgi:hypothetical protein
MAGQPYCCSEYYQELVLGSAYSIEEVNDLECKSERFEYLCRLSQYWSLTINPIDIHNMSNMLQQNFVPRLSNEEGSSQLGSG